jgi:ParB family chromosome partitioning protein
MLDLIPITAITPNPQPRLRRLNGEKVQALVQSIQEIGVQSPISLRAHPVMEATPCNHNGKLYSVVAGEHRLEACRRLGWKDIPAFIIDLDDAHCQLWEIDENLVRAELTQLERAEHIRVRKIVYERIHPETKHGGDHGNQYTGGKPRQDPNSGSCQCPPCFIDDTAEKTGMSRAAVAQAVHRAEAIDPEVKDAIRDTPEIADKGVELDALAAVEPEEQKAAVEAVKSGKARTVREATKGAKKRNPKRSRKAKPEPSDEEIVRRAVIAAVKQCQKRIAHRLAAIQINCDGNATDVVVAFRE